MTVCSDDNFQMNKAFVAKLGIVMHHHVPEYHARRFVCCLNNNNNNNNNNNDNSISAVLNCCGIVGQKYTHS